MNYQNKQNQIKVKKGVRFQQPDLDQQQKTFSIQNSSKISKQQQNAQFNHQNIFHANIAIPSITHYAPGIKQHIRNQRRASTCLKPISNILNSNHHTIENDIDIDQDQCQNQNQQKQFKSSKNYNLNKNQKSFHKNQKQLLLKSNTSIKFFQRIKNKKYKSQFIILNKNGKSSHKIQGNNPMNKEQILNKVYDFLIKLIDHQDYLKKILDEMQFNKMKIKKNDSESSGQDKQLLRRSNQSDFTQISQLPKSLMIPFSKTSSIQFITNNANNNNIDNSQGNIIKYPSIDKIFQPNSSSMVNAQASLNFNRLTHILSQIQQQVQSQNKIMSYQQIQFKLNKQKSSQDDRSSINRFIKDKYQQNQQNQYQKGIEHKRNKCKFLGSGDFKNSYLNIQNKNKDIYQQLQNNKTDQEELREVSLIIDSKSQKSQKQCSFFQLKSQIDRRKNSSVSLKICSQMGGGSSCWFSSFNDSDNFNYDDILQKLETQQFDKNLLGKIFDNGQDQVPQALLINLALCLLMKYFSNQSLNSTEIKLNTTNIILLISLSTLIAYKIFYDLPISGLMDYICSVITLKNDEVKYCQRKFIQILDYEINIENQQFFKMFQNVFLKRQLSEQQSI